MRLGGSVIAGLSLPVVAMQAGQRFDGLPEAGAGLGDLLLGGLYTLHGDRSFTTALTLAARVPLTHQPLINASAPRVRAGVATGGTVQ